jgi:hypothetical protein
MDVRNGFCCQKVCLRLFSARQERAQKLFPVSLKLKKTETSHE